MDYDIIIIGSGPGGYVAAIRAAQLGRRVAIIERSELGGVCLNWGCIPTKAMLKSAQVYTYLNHAASYGLEVEGAVRVSLEKIVARSRSVADNMSKGVKFLLDRNGVAIIEGSAKLIAPNRVAVGGAEYSADHIILATGARPRELDTVPVDGVHVITSKQALMLDKLPSSMVVVGSGAIGSEFAYLYAALGVKVTIVEYMPQIMPLEDEEVSKAMERAFRKMRVQCMTSTKVLSVSHADGVCTIEIEGKKGAATLTADVVLSAAGIVANIKGLGLEELGVEVANGKVVVDKESYQTNIKGIYAIGDIIATPALAHVASAEAQRCVERICSLTPSPIDYSAIPSCVYTQPEVASVGLTEAQATAQGLNYSVGRFPFTASGKATAAGERDGFAKLIFDDQKRIVGAHLVGANVTEMIASPTLLKILGVDAHFIAESVHPHPTMSEAIMEAAEAALGHAIHTI